jgi:Zn-dependent protease
MGNGFRIGRLFGIEFRVDPSWLFIFVLISWSLTSLFASWHPEWSFPTSLIVALVAALLFFVSILIHELAHSAVALAYGIPVRDITLHLFGGVSNIEKEPPTPRAEGLMAIVGPIASIGLGIGMLTLSSLLIGLRVPDADDAETLVSRLGPIETLLVWLGPVNIIVGLFNMIPGFPLDGGRVLRAIVWRITGDLDRATRVAGGVGQAVGWLFVILGAAMALGVRIPFFGRGITSGLWLALIGLFLRNAAVAHVRGSAVDHALSNVGVRSLMRVNGAVVDARLPVRQLVDEWFLRHDEPAYPVVQDGIFAGIVSVEDLRKVPSGEWEIRCVSDVMTPGQALVVAAPDEPLSEAVRKLARAGVSQLPVLQEGRLVGMLWEKDVARWLQLQDQSTRRPAPPRVRHA